MRKVLICMGYAVPFMLPAAHAEPEPVHVFSGNVAITTDYLFRGYSQTKEQSAIQAGLDYEHAPSGLYLGAWGSEVEFDGDDKTDIEIDFYGGIAGEFTGGVSWDVGGIFYYYPDQNEKSNTPHYDYLEVYGALGYTFENSALQPTVGAKFSYSGDYFGEDGDGFYPEASLDLVLPQEFGLGFHVGYLDVKGDETVSAGYDYLHWSVGLSKEIAGFGFDLSYNDANHNHACPDDLCQTLVFSASRDF